MATKNIGLWTPGQTGVQQGPVGPAGVQGQPAPGDEWWESILYPAAGVGGFCRLLSGGNVLQIQGQYWPAGPLAIGTIYALGWTPASKAPQGVRQFAVARAQKNDYSHWCPVVISVNWGSPGGLIELLTLQFSVVYVDFRTVNFSMYPIA